MMKQRYYIFLLFVAMLSYSGYAQKSILRLSQQTLMHEVRETPSPLDGQHIAVNPPRFMWFALCRRPSPAKWGRGTGTF